MFFSCINSQGGIYSLFCDIRGPPAHTVMAVFRDIFHYPLSLKIRPACSCLIHHHLSLARWLLCKAWKAWVGLTFLVFSFQGWLFFSEVLLSRKHSAILVYLKWTVGVLTNVYTRGTHTLIKLWSISIPTVNSSAPLCARALTPSQHSADYYCYTSALLLNSVHTDSYNVRSAVLALIHAWCMDFRHHLPH